MNTPAGWTCASPAFGAVASAQGLASFYQICLGSLNPPGTSSPFIPDEVRSWMTTIVTDGEDKTMLTPTAYSCGFMLDPRDPATGIPLRHLFGYEGFGHAGAGGSHAFADPINGLSFAYTMNHMDLNVLPGTKTQALVNALTRVNHPPLPSPMKVTKTRATAGLIISASLLVSLVFLFMRIIDNSKITWESGLSLGCAILWSGHGVYRSIIRLKEVGSCPKNWSDVPQMALYNNPDHIGYFLWNLVFSPWGMPISSSLNLLLLVWIGVYAYKSGMNMFVK